MCVCYVYVFKAFFLSQVTIVLVEIHKSVGIPIKRGTAISRGKLQSHWRQLLHLDIIRTTLESGVSGGEGGEGGRGEGVGEGG